MNVGLARDRLSSGQRRALAFVAAMLLAFGTGAGWQYARATGLQRELRETQTLLTFYELEAALGAATIEAQRPNFQMARNLASEFFTGMQDAMHQAPPAAQRHFAEVLAERDAIITGLSRSDTNAATRLAFLFLRYRSGMAEVSAAFEES